MEGYCFGRQSSDQIAGGLRLDQCHHAIFLDKTKIGFYQTS